VAARLKPFKEKILRDHTGQEVLIIGHMIVNRFLIGMLLEYPPEEIQRMEQNNGCVYLVERNGEARVSHFIDGEIREGFFSSSPKDPLGKGREGSGLFSGHCKKAGGDGSSKREMEVEMCDLRLRWGSLRFLRSQHKII
jgi:hypothetical protein